LTEHASDVDLSTWNYVKLKRELAVLQKLERDDEILVNRITHRRIRAAWNIAYGRLEEKRRADIRALEAAVKSREGL
jgi:hypothetical protein